MAEADGEIRHTRVCSFDHNHCAPALFAIIIMGSFFNVFNVFQFISACVF